MTWDVQVLPRGQRSASPFFFCLRNSDQPWLRFHPSATRWSEHSYTSVGCSAFSPSFGALIGSSTRENCNGKARGSFHGRFFCPPCFGGENCPNFGPTYQVWLVLEHFFYFSICWDDDPIWLIFFRGVETTNQPILLLLFWCWSTISCAGKIPCADLVCNHPDDTTRRPVQYGYTTSWLGFAIIHCWTATLVGLCRVGDRFSYFPEQIPPKNRRIHGFYMILSICIPRWWVTFLRCGAVGCPTWSSTVSTFHLQQLSGRMSSKAGMVTGCNFFSAFSFSSDW